MSSAIHRLLSFIETYLILKKYFVLEPREVGSAHNVRQTNKKKSWHDKLYMRIVDEKKKKKLPVLYVRTRRRLGFYI